VSHRHPANMARHDQRDFGQRAADAVAAGIGSWRFLITQSVILACWMTVLAIWVTSGDLQVAVVLEGAAHRVDERRLVLHLIRCNAIGP
jgi:hypothetical protein